MLHVLWNLCSLIRDWTQSLSTDIRSPNYWTAREFPHLLFAVKLQVNTEHLVVKSYRLEERRIRHPGNPQTIRCFPSNFKRWVENCDGEGNGNPLQYSCLENPVDRGAWWAAVHRVAQSQTRLKWLSSSSSSRKLQTTIFTGQKNV